MKIWRDHCIGECMQLFGLACPRRCDKLSLGMVHAECMSVTGIYLSRAQ